MLTIALLLTLFVVIGDSQFIPQNLGGKSGDCFKDFPYLLGRFSWEQLEFFCQQKRAFDLIIYGNQTAQPLSDAQLEYINTLRLDLNVTKNDVYRHERKEYRLMTVVERRRFIWALNGLRQTFIDGVSKYDLLVLLAHPSLAPGSHVGGAFLPWHREYLRLFQEALHQLHPLAFVPYWDVTLDSALPNPADSILWTPDLFGNGDGLVTDGPFAGWTFAAFENLTDNEPLPLSRNISQNGALFTTDLVDFFLTRKRFRDLTACIDLTLEKSSRMLHDWVGGAMETMYYAPQDPVFFMHHAFLDYLWYQYRQQQTPEQRLYDYPLNYEACTVFHYGYSLMEPFGPLRNIDGLSEVYDYYTGYQEVPTCSEDYPNCASEYLFCNVQLGRCLSKIKPGGNCTGLEPADMPCYQSECYLGICVSDVPVQTTFSQTLFDETSSIVPTSTKSVTDTLNSTATEFYDTDNATTALFHDQSNSLVDQHIRSSDRV